MPPKGSSGAAYGAELTLPHVLDRDVEQTINPERTLTWAKNASMALVPKSNGLAVPVHARAICGSLVEENNQRGHPDRY
jgi:hypothetical protein